LQIYFWARSETRLKYDFISLRAQIWPKAKIWFKYAYIYDQ
jgi:hypothetical protein